MKEGNNPRNPAPNDLDPDPRGRLAGEPGTTTVRIPLGPCPVRVTRGQFVCCWYTQAKQSNGTVQYCIPTPTVRSQPAISTRERSCFLAASSPVGESAAFTDPHCPPLPFLPLLSPLFPSPLACTLTSFKGALTPHGHVQRRVAMPIPCNYDLR